jgi:hypothetical protein
MINPDSLSATPHDDPDSTMALLHAALPDVTGVAGTLDLSDDDSDEESDKELSERSSKCVEISTF